MFQNLRKAFGLVFTNQNYLFEMLLRSF